MIFVSLLNLIEQAMSQIAVTHAVTCNIAISASE